VKWEKRIRGKGDEGSRRICEADAEYDGRVRVQQTGRHAGVIRASTHESFPPPVKFKTAWYYKLPYSGLALSCNASNRWARTASVAAQSTSNTVWLEEGLSLPPSTALSVMACLSSTARGDAASTPFLCLCACKRPRCQPQQLQLPCRRPQPLQSQNHKLNYTTKLHPVHSAV
jgi:hypothetical protein